jgi:thioredoxin reductase
MATTHQSPSGMYDVVVVGGGAAGLSAAVTLSRALRSVVVIDAGEPRNAPADGVHGFLSREGMSPIELLAAGRAEAESYGATIIDAEATDVRRIDRGFEIALADGRVMTGRRLLLTSGLVDDLPAIPGLAEQWGKGVVHCPYCHGYEIRGQRIGVLGTNPLSVHQTLLFRQWSQDVTLFLNGVVSPTDEEWDKLTARSVRVVEGAVASVDSVDGVLTGVSVQGGAHFDLRALVVGPRMRARAGVLDESLGLAPQEAFAGMASFIEAGPMGTTTAPGVYVAGNVSNIAAQVIVAAAEGTSVGMKINADLIEQETAWAVMSRNGPFSAAVEAHVTERVLGDRRHGLDAATSSTAAPLESTTTSGGGDHAR